MTSPPYHPALAALGGRKYLLVVLVTLAHFILLATGRMSESTYEHLTIALVVGYVLSNMGKAIAVRTTKDEKSIKLTKSEVVEAELGNNPSTDYSTV